MNKIGEDILNWIVNYIEVDHKFYDYKFPPCPYARSARLKGLVDIQTYSNGSKWDFVSTHVDQLINNKQHSVCIMAFPAYSKWNVLLHCRIKQLNKKLISKDYYIQYGSAIKTQSRYPGLLSGKPYFIVIVNRLSDVLSGHQALLKTDYYHPWANYHYNDVVVRRRNMYEKYSKIE
jgi:hypothetical protein